MKVQFSFSNIKYYGFEYYIYYISFIYYFIIVKFIYYYSEIYFLFYPKTIILCISKHFFMKLKLKIYSQFSLNNLMY